MVENSGFGTNTDNEALQGSAAKQETEFEKAAKGRRTSLPREFLQFLIENKKWWLLPIALVLLVLGLLTVFATTGAAPFVYTLF